MFLRCHFDRIDARNEKLRVHQGKPEIVTIRSQNFNQKPVKIRTFDRKMLSMDAPDFVQ